jgi:predicted DNA-binding transcriptional regulator AlpA
MRSFYFAIRNDLYLHSHPRMCANNFKYTERTLLVIRMTFFKTLLYLPTFFKFMLTLFWHGFKYFSKSTKGQSQLTMKPQFYVDPEFFTLPEFCSWAKVSRSGAYVLMAEGLPTLKIGRSVRIPISKARDWLNSHPAARIAPPAPRKTKG